MRTNQNLTKIIAILLIALIASTLSSSQLFIYSSLTSLFGYLIIATVLIIFSSVLLLTSNSGNFAISNTVPIFIFGLWIVYIVMHNLFVNASGLRLQYFLINFLLFGTLIVLFRTNFYRPEFLFKTIMFLAGIESVVCLGQFLDFTQSNNTYFRVTGTWENPNVTAMFLAMAFPAIVFFILGDNKSWKRIAVISALLTIIAILLLQCRTAVIGCLLSLLIVLERRFRLSDQFLKLKSFTKIIIAASGFIIITLAGIFMYEAKKTSADGRKLIWKVSLNMIKEKPLIGYGYASFEKNYNLAQAKYFGSGQGTASERRNAAFVFMAYNEFIENSVEGGIIGLLLFTGFLVSLLIIPFRKNLSQFKIGNKKKSDQDFQFFIAYSGVAVFALMSLINFTIQAIPVFCLLVCYASIVCSTYNLSYNESKILSFKFHRLQPKVVIGFCSIIAMFLLYSITEQANAQLKNRQGLYLAKEGDLRKAIEVLEPLKSSLQNHESYWKTYGNILFAAKACKQAIEKLESAKNLTSNPEVFIKVGECYEAIRDFKNAQKNYLIAKNIEPNKLKPVYSLMKLFLKTKDTVNAISTANEIISLQSKIASKQTELYKQQAISVINLLSNKIRNNQTNRM